MPEVRANFHGDSEIRITKLIANETDPFNIAMCDDVYFNTVSERDLTLKLLKTAKLYLEERTDQYLSQQYEEPSKKMPRVLTFDQTIKYLQRFYIGGGRMSFYLSNIYEPQSIQKAKKNIYYNIDVSIVV